MERKLANGGLRRLFIASFFMITFALNGNSVHAQCAPGVPSAGNPGCIPPNAPGSPYYQDQAPSPRSIPQTVKWSSRWGAVAIDDESGRGGTVEDRESEGIARDIATDLCRKNGGNNCKVLIAYHDQCAALAQTLGGGKIFATSAVNSQKAERMALDNCNSDRCAIIYSKCSLAQPTD